MNIQGKKLEILDWIMHINDLDILKKIETILISSKSKMTSNQVNENVPEYGLFKGKIHMTSDFDEPLEDFKEYMQ